MDIQLISLAGAALCVLAYYLSTRHTEPPHKVRRYSVALVSTLYMAGSAILFGVATLDGRAGFMALNAAWFTIALADLLRTDDPYF
jgi:hypothetical protein